ncbi:MAG TPA: hypothetical protein VLK65_01965 [Vicinamibacteria bacterium]|nr:hypothetical protein [Vicinamibacteria bacterium]
MSHPRWILLLLAVAGSLLLHRYYALMPDPMASSFDGSGRPSGFQSRDVFFSLSGAMLLLVVVLFGGIGNFFKILPTTWFNLPNRRYWLSPERREATMDFMARQMEWFGVATITVLIVTVKLAFDANLTPAHGFDASTMWWLLGLYFAYTGGWLFHFVRRFRKKS